MSPVLVARLELDSPYLIQHNSETQGRTGNLSHLSRQPFLPRHHGLQLLRFFSQLFNRLLPPIGIGIVGDNLSPLD